MDPSVQALHYLDIIQMKDSVHKLNFYHNLKNLLPTIPTVSCLFVWFVFTFKTHAFVECRIMAVKPTFHLVYINNNQKTVEI